MPLPKPQNGLQIKPRPQIITAQEGYPHSRVINPNLWMDITCSSVMTFAAFKALPAQLAKWDSSNWLANAGVPSGYRFRLKSIGSTKQFSDTEVEVSLEIEAQRVSAVTIPASNVWLLTCPRRESFSITPLPTHIHQQFSSGRGRIIGRRKGALERFSAEVIANPIKFLEFLEWYQGLMLSGNLTITTTWLGSFSANTSFRFAQPWTATREAYNWKLQFEGVTCGNL